MHKPKRVALNNVKKEHKLVVIDGLLSAPYYGYKIRSFIDHLQASNFKVSHPRCVFKL